MSTSPVPAGHPVAAAIERVEAEVAGVSETALWSMTAAEAGEALRALSRLRARTDELLGRVLRHAETVETGLDTGATSTTNWWAAATNTTRVEAHRIHRLAHGLEEYPSVRDAVAAGRLLTDQAAVIVHAVDELPDDVEAWVPDAAVKFLLTEARDRDAKQLRVLGRRLLEVIDPEAADAEEARRLEQEERDAHAAASFTITDDGHGKCHGRFTLPTLHGQMLRQHLQAIALNKRAEKSAATPGDTKPGAKPVQRPVERPLSRHRLGEAFIEYLETRSDDTIPAAGGVPATVVVTMDLDTLIGGLKAASLDTGGRISAGEARRLACRAGIIPAVLGGKSVVLDVGRRRRLHTQAQRIALGLRDRGCTAQGCDTPPGMCHAHHDIGWSKGGGTSLANGRLLCPAHHRRIHDPTFGHTLDKHGQVRFTRRT